MAITLGSIPHQLRVVLTRDGDFNSTLTNSVGPWDAGISIELRFGAEVWAATISGSDAVFSVDKAVVNTLLDTKNRRAKLFYIDGTSDIIWATGEIDD